MKKIYFLLIALLFSATMLNAATLTVKANNDAWGTVTGGGEDVRGYVTITATPAEGCFFIGWYDQDNNLVTSDLSYEVWMHDEDKTFTAKFAEEVAVSVHVSTPGTLAQEIINAGSRAAVVTKLTVTGTLNEEDYKTMRESASLLYDIDLSGVTDTEMPSLAFRGKSSLKSIVLPESLTSIGDRTFSQCYSLTSITIGNSVTSIESQAFRYCESLSFITIPNSVTSIGNWAFSDCDALTSISIPNSVTSIEDEAFRYCPLTDITCYAGVPPTCGSDVFSSDVYITATLTVPEVSKNDYLITSPWDAFLNIETMDIDYYKITATSNDTEMGYVVGSKYYLPNDTVKLEAKPNFYNWAEAGGEIYYKFKQWSDGNTENPRVFVATEDVTLVAEFIIPPYEVTLTCNEVQGTVSGGGEYELGSQVTITATAKEGYQFSHWRIYYNKWDYNTIYENPYTFEIGSQFYDIEAIFEEIPSYNVNVSSSNENWGSVIGGGTYFQGDTTTITATPAKGYMFDYFNIYYDYGYSTTSNENPLHFDYINQNYQIIAHFKQIPVLIDGLYYYLTDAQNLTDAQEGITVRFNTWEWGQVNIWAWNENGDLFESWPGIPMNYDGNGWWSYTFDSSIENINVLFNDGGYGSQTADIEGITGSICYRYAEDRVIYVEDCPLYESTATVAYAYEGEYSGSIVVPDQVIYNNKTYKVVSIERNAFQGHPITSLSITNNITGGISLSECYDLKVLKAHAYFISNATGLWDSNLEEVYYTGGYVGYVIRIPSLKVIDLSLTENTELERSLFREDTDGNYERSYNLRKLVLPNGLTTIYERQFRELWSLEEIVIPNGVTEIPEAAFYDCHALSKVTLSKNLTSIGNYAFYSCHALENIVIPEGVTEVGDAAFYGCTYLDSLALPSTTQRIGDNCFALCSRMKQINVNAIEPPTIFAKTFFDVNRNIPVIVPEGAREAYANDEYWGEFINVVESEDTETQIENTENANVAIYSVGGVLYIDGLSADYQLFDVNGRLIYTGRDAQLSLPRGVYVIAVGGEVEKIVL